MLSAILLAVQVVISRDTDSVYGSARVRDLVAAASVANREAPARLGAYRARLESEIGLLLADTLGRERTGQVEEVASQVRWSRDSGYETHVVGYRTQSAGIPISMVGMFNSWSLPMLYGERLMLGVESSRETNVEIPRRGSRPDTVVAAHPFAADREHYYRYGGGG